MICPACGNETKSGGRFCDKCGAELSRACPHCQTPVDAGKRFCPHCGNLMPGGVAAGQQAAVFAATPGGAGGWQAAQYGSAPVYAAQPQKKGGAV